MSPRKVKVAVQPGVVVYSEGVAYQRGQTLEVTPDEAKALMGQGLVEKA